MTRIRVAIAQMSSGDVLRSNLAAAEGLLARAADQGAQLVALPENFAFMRREGAPYPCAQGLDGEIVDFLRAQAQKHAIWLLGGTFPEKISGEERVHNTSLMLSPDGECVARYRKLHLFDVDLGEDAGAFRESDVIAAGEDVVLAQLPFGPVGLSICYDLRFPELYRQLVEAGARWFMVPSAFAPATGKDHWEVLLRARAIENQVFVVAAAQCGRHTSDRSSYGRSMIIDPWGLVLASGGDQPCVIVADCDLAEQERVRGAIPCLQNRRL